MNNESVGKKIVEALKKQAENIELDEPVESSLFDEPVEQSNSGNIFAETAPETIDLFSEIEEEKEVPSVPEASVQPEPEVPSVPAEPSVVPEPEVPNVLEETVQPEPAVENELPLPNIEEPVVAEQNNTEDNSSILEPVTQEEVSNEVTEVPTPEEVIPKYDEFMKG